VRPDSSGRRPARPLTFVPLISGQRRAMEDQRIEQQRPERIGAEGTEPVGAAPRHGDARKRDLEEELDAALACTFPASDPVGCLGTELNCASKPDD
jgi:hypothetical protein